MLATSCDDPPTKRRRTQSSIGSFFTARNTTIPQPHSPQQLLSPPSIPSAPPTPTQTATTAIPDANLSYTNGPLIDIAPATPPPTPAPQHSICPCPHTLDIPPTALTEPPNPEPPQPAPPPISDDHHEAPISRLSRSRTLARRAKHLAQPPAAAIGPAPRNAPPVRELHAEKAAVRKKLHPFFAATKAAVKESRQRVTKRPRVALVSHDPWNAPGATVHVNAPPPPRGFRVVPGRVMPGRVIAGTARKIMPMQFSVYSKSSVTVPRPLVTRVEYHHYDTWAETYKRDTRIDVINAPASTQLMDWLRRWYQPVKRNDAFSDDSMDTFEPHLHPLQKERVAIVTGPVGSGKSTLVANAARQLGLSILEINASVCRSGKKIREIIGDALNTHRVSPSSVFQGFANNSNQSGKPLAKTLILFEEVDELFEDEKGFWSALQKLANAVDSRRPIICTANRFDSQMRQYFMESKGVVEEDLSRLFVQTRSEQPLNPLNFKHIQFTTRSERQAAAVLNRVATSEKLLNANHIVDCLATLYTNDTRKAINLFQFWASRGIGEQEEHQPPPRPVTRRRTRSSGSPDPQPPEVSRRSSRKRKEKSIYDSGNGFLSALVNDAAKHTLFCVGVDNAVVKAAESSRNSKSSTADDETALDHWCTSLEIMSQADAMRGCVAQQDHFRSVQFGTDADSLCGHQDFLASEQLTQTLDEEAFAYSFPYLSFKESKDHLQDLTNELSVVQEKLVDNFSTTLPVARQAILTDYIPILQVMAKNNEKLFSGKAPDSMNNIDRPMRRTRALSKKSGFFSLDLDPATVTALKKTSVRR